MPVAQRFVSPRFPLFDARIAVRIALVSLLLAGAVGPLAWWLGRKGTEDAVVAMAAEESARILHHSGLTGRGAALDEAMAGRAAEAIIGGLFDIAEIYRPDGYIMAARFTPAGEAVENALPPHDTPTAREPLHESLSLPDGRWVMRVILPLPPRPADSAAPLLGYFEGIRVVPDWQRTAIVRQALKATGLVALAALLCGLALYPVVMRLQADIRRRAAALVESNLSMLDALGRAIARRDSDTGAHNYRVAWIASGIGERLGLGAQAMQALIAGSFLHDVGKIGVPDALLNKPGALNDDETAVMRSHVTLGSDIIRGTGWLDAAAEVVACHHEHWDGSGYPHGLKGEDIPLSARIFAVADVFDALCTRRVYKDALPYDVAIAMLQRDAGSHFDPRVLAAFEPIAREVHEVLRLCSDEECRYLFEERVSRYFGVDSMRRL